jgi:hypothetical protein
MLDLCSGRRHRDGDGLSSRASANGGASTKPENKTKRAPKKHQCQLSP